MKRKTAKDYKDIHNGLLSGLTRLNNEVNKRLNDLVFHFPDAIIGYVGEGDEKVPMKAKTTLTKQYIDALDILEIIKYIDIFEI